MTEVSEAALKDKENLASVLVEAIKEKTLSYDPSKDKEDGKEFDTTEKVGFFYMAFKYANGSDKCLFFSACISSFLSGAALPVSCVLIGGMIDGIGGVDSYESLSD